LQAIADKLARLQTFTLSQIQDIAGCRAILDEPQSVIDLAKNLRRDFFGHELHDVDDYIATPRSTGYRGIHLIYRFNSEKRLEYNGLKVELQLRSKSQHSWATSVELVSTLTGEGLKNDIGNPRWRRLFALVSDALAFVENTAPVPGTPTDLGLLSEELDEIVQQLNPSQALSTYGVIIDNIGRRTKSDYYFLMHLHLDASGNNRVEVRRFTQEQAGEATDAYQELETKIGSSPSAQAVLVSVQDVKKLRKAYPNFFLQATAAVNLIRSVQELIKDPSYKGFQWAPASEIASQDRLISGERPRSGSG
jgi:hypothetical protein